MNKIEALIKKRYRQTVKALMDFDESKDTSKFTESTLQEPYGNSKGKEMNWWRDSHAPS